MTTNNIDALRINLRKRISPSSKNPYDKKSNIFIALSHFSDFQIDRFHPNGNSTSRDKSDEPEKQFLKDMILPHSRKLRDQEEYEVQHIYLGKWVYQYQYKENSDFESSLKDGKTDRSKSIFSNDEGENLPAILISNVKFLLDHESVFLEDRHLLAIEEGLNNLFKDDKRKNSSIQLEIRDSLGFGDYCFIIRAEELADIFFVYEMLYKLARSKENCDSVFSKINFIYSIPGIAINSYDEVVENWDQQTDSDKKIRSILLTSMPSEWAKAKSKSEDEVLGEAEEIEEKDDQEDSGIRYLFGNYDLIAFDELLPSDKIWGEYRYKTRLLFPTRSFQELIQSMNDIRGEDFQNRKKDLTEHWKSFSWIVKTNDDINHQEPLNERTVLTNIHLLSLEHHLSLYSRNITENVIESSLLDEWNSIIEDFLQYCKAFMELIKNLSETNGKDAEDTKDDKDKTGNKNGDMQDLINYFRYQYEESIRLINRATRHWILGAKSQVEYSGSENIYHFGNTSKVYCFYTLLFNILQDSFSEKSAYSSNEERVNFFAVPNNSSATTSMPLFSEFNPDQSRLISINISSEIIFNFQWLGLVMHETGHYISHKRFNRNVKILQLIEKDLASKLTDIFYKRSYLDYPPPEKEEKKVTYKSPLTPLIQKQARDNTTQDILNVLHEKIFDVSSPENPLRHKYETLYEERTDKKLSDKGSILFLPLEAFTYLILQFFPDIEHGNLETRVMELINKKPGYFNDFGLFQHEKWKNAVIDQWNSVIKNHLQPIVLNIAVDFIKLINDLEEQIKDYFENHKELLFQNIDIDNKLASENKYLLYLSDMRKEIREAFDIIPKNIKDLDYLKFENTIRTKALISETEVTDYLSEVFIDGEEKEKDFFDACHQFVRLAGLLDQCEKFGESRLKIDLSQAKFEITNYLAEKKLLSGCDEEQREIKKYLKKILFNQIAPYEYKASMLFDYMEESVLNYTELFKEVKADYFMCKVLALSRNQYRSQYNFNITAQVDYQRFNEQRDVREEILGYAGAFYGDNGIEDMDEIEHLSEGYLIANTIKKSIGPVVEDVLKYPAIRRCRDIFTEEKEITNIGEELQLIEDVLKASDEKKAKMNGE